MTARGEPRPARDEERPRPTQAAGLEPRIKLWLEKDGALVLSDFRVQLLRHVAESGSLAEAAQRMGLSYRRAWGKVREIERNLGVTLVESEVGGVGGGSSHLTPQGERLVTLYQRFSKRMERIPDNHAFPSSLHGHLLSEAPCHKRTLLLQPRQDILPATQQAV